MDTTATVKCNETARTRASYWAHRQEEGKQPSEQAASAQGARLAENNRGAVALMTQLLFQQWLPPPVAEEAQRRERALFGNLFRALAEDWEASKDLPPAERNQASLRWISLVNRCEVSYKMFA